MRRYRFVTPVLLGLCFVAFASLAPQPVEAAAEPQVAALAPGMARVWFSAAEGFAQWQCVGSIASDLREWRLHR
jgi:hypothetical protein